jgi:hypothetical protein
MTTEEASTSSSPTSPMTENLISSSDFDTCRADYEKYQVKRSPTNKLVPLDDHSADYDSVSLYPPAVIRKSSEKENDISTDDPLIINTLATNEKDAAYWEYRAERINFYIAVYHLNEFYDDEKHILERAEVLADLDMELYEQERKEKKYCSTQQREENAEAIIRNAILKIIRSEVKITVRGIDMRVIIPTIIARIYDLGISAGDILNNEADTIISEIFESESFSAMKAKQNEISNIFNKEIDLYEN